MPPPLPPSELGHSLGPRDARVTLGGHLDYVVRTRVHACWGCSIAARVISVSLPIRQSVLLVSFNAFAQCPYSKKTFTAIRKQVAPHYRDKSFRFVFHHQVQP